MPYVLGSYCAQSQGILTTPNDPIMFRNDYIMAIAQPVINTPIYFPNLLFIVEEYQSSYDSVNLEEES